MDSTSLRELWPLTFWDKQEWYDVQRKLDWMEENGLQYNPGHSDILRSLHCCSLADCRVIVASQDPYPKPAHCTGNAFECDRVSSEGVTRTTFPASLRTIFREYERTVGFLPLGQWPRSGCLERWYKQGVLLWNVTPTIEVERHGDSFKTYTHQYWPEWQALSREIVSKLSDKGEIVFAFLGSRAKQYAKHVNTDNGVNTPLFFSHPSPMAQRWTKDSFIGSDFFTKINKALVKHHRKPINWRLE